MTHFIHMRLLPLLLLLLSLSPVLQAQTYRLQLGRTAALTGGGVVLAFGSEGLMRQVSPLTPAELGQLDPADVWRLDRLATDNWSPSVARTSDAFLYGSMAAPPLLALLHPRSREEFPAIATMWAETGLITYGLTGLGKWAVRRRRPFTYLPAGPGYPGLAEAQGARDARFSFPSGHSSMTAAMCFFSARVYHDLFPDSPARPVVWVLAAVIPASVAWMRVRAGKHFPSDVITGYLLGATVGISLPALHRR